VQALHGRGFSLAIDDFGTGYASLTYLSDFPIAVLKLDRSFVSRVAHDEFQRRLLAGVIALAANLGATTTAEGIELPEQAEVLESLGCTHGQGWLWAPALPVAELNALLGEEHPFGTRSRR
jgi:EAL domain-containing protein (putative c-di-GMP-specific phosphodiesterase class I)